MVVRQSLVPIPADANGLLYVATNQPIRVGVEGTQVVTKEDVGGYYLIHRRDWAALMAELKQHRQKSNPAPGP